MVRVFGFIEWEMELWSVDFLFILLVTIDLFNVYRNYAYINECLSKLNLGRFKEPGE